MEDTTSLVKPNTRYSWASDATFTLNSNQFSTLLNTLNAIAGSPVFATLLEEAKQKVLEGNTILAVGELQVVMTQALGTAIAAGTAVEMSEASNNIPLPVPEAPVLP